MKELEKGLGVLRKKPLSIEEVRVPINGKKVPLLTILFSNA
jgi:hypothetical protein